MPLLGFDVDILRPEAGEYPNEFTNMNSSAALSASPSLLRRDDAAGVATLTLTAPASRNALSSAMIETLSAALADIARAPDVRAMVISGEGPAFSSGHDLRELAAHRNDSDSGDEFYQRLMAACAAMMQAIVALPKPVIAAIEGVATAAGCQLVAACDLAIAGQGARFATPGVDIGLFCSTPLVAIARTISRKHAMEMALTGAAKTLAIGKKAFYDQVELNLGDAYARAGRAMVENLLHADADEGIGAFLQKRRPHWENE
jgi:enoyl-CoA hydratase/carnithine racemase